MTRSRLRGTPRATTVALAAGAVLLATVSACAATNSGSDGAAGTTAATTASTPPTEVPGSSTVWLCFPGTANDPCTESLDATAIDAHGTRTVEHVTPSAGPPIDCFYVYPTVSTQKTPNADLTIDPAETNVAVLQASRFSHECRVYAPMYREATLSAIFSGDTGVNFGETYGDVLNAWNDYLAHYNKGRGVVLIGHSQGSFVLEQLVANQIDTNATERAKLVSAVLLGGSVRVPAPGAPPTTAPTTTASAPAAPSSVPTTLAPRGASGRPGAGFANVPPCSRTNQTGCVVAYSSFDQTPPADSLFGRSGSGTDEIACVNPADPASPLGTADPVTPYLPTKEAALLPGGDVTGVTTAWITYPGLFSAACEYQGGASWLQVNDVRGAGDTRPHLVEALGPTWGLHLIDVNIALGNLVHLVHEEAAAWVVHHSGS